MIESSYGMWMKTNLVPMKNIRFYMKINAWIHVALSDNIISIHFAMVFFFFGCDNNRRWEKY